VFILDFDRLQDSARVTVIEFECSKEVAINCIYWRSLKIEVSTRT